MEDVACIDETKNRYKILVRITSGKDLFGNQGAASKVYYNWSQKECENLK
jgi:hypothetical protein